MTMRISASSSTSLAQLSDRVSRGFTSVELKTSQVALQTFDAVRRTLLTFRDALEYVSIHVPMRWRGQWTDLASRDPRIASSSMQCLTHCITLAQAIDCHRIVFHAYSPHAQLENLGHVQRDRATALHRLTQVLQRLGEACERAEVILCWENINAWVELRDQRWFNTLNVFPRDICTVFEMLDLPFLRLAFDAAHALNACTEYRRDARLRHLFPQEARALTVATFLQRVVPWVELLHVSDAKESQGGTGREGLPLGDGDIDLPAFFTVVRQQLLGTPLILEIHEEDVDAAVRMQRGRDRIHTNYRVE